MRKIRIYSLRVTSFWVVTLASMSVACAQSAPQVIFWTQSDFGGQNSDWFDISASTNIPLSSLSQAINGPTATIRYSGAGDYAPGGRFPEVIAGVHVLVKGPVGTPFHLSYTRSASANASNYSAPQGMSCGSSSSLSVSSRSATAMGDSAAALLANVIIRPDGPAVSNSSNDSGTIDSISTGVTGITTYLGQTYTNAWNVGVQADSSISPSPSCISSGHVGFQGELNIAVQVTNGAPPPPTNVHATQIGFDGTQIQLTWEYGSDPIDGFSIEGKVPSGSSIAGIPAGSDGWVPLTTLLSPQARLMDMNAPNVPVFGTVSYRLRAFHGSNTSGPSTEATVFQVKLSTLNCGLGPPVLPPDFRTVCTSPVLWPLFSGIYNAIVADFMPDPTKKLSEVAQLFHYDHFNWISTISYLPPSVTEFKDYNGNQLPPIGNLTGIRLPFLDPPLGGYDYWHDRLGTSCGPSGPTNDFLPYYWDEQLGCVGGYLLSRNTSPNPSPNNLNFFDRPHSLQLGQSDYIQFVTSLVGVSVGGASSTSLATFFWSSNNRIDGIGGLADAGSSGSGTGGILNIAMVNPKDLPVSVRTLLMQAGVQGITTAPKVDKDPPTTTAVLTGPGGTNGWYTGLVTVTLIATDIDGPTDIAATSYRLDNGPAISYTGPLTVSGAGTHTIVFGSVDRALNAETPLASQSFKIDATSPVILPTIVGTPGTNGWYRNNVTVSWSVTDPQSGIATSSGCTATTLTTDTAGVTLTCSATNGAGLTTSVPVTVKIDRTPPVISGLPVPGCTLWPPNHKLVQVAAVTAGDALSGMAAFNVTGLSSESPDPGETDVVIAGSGLQPRSIQLRAERSGSGNGRTYTLTATASDLAGNSSTASARCTVPHDEGH